MPKKVQDRGVKASSSQLKGRRIAYCLTGGIGSVESVKNIREIRRRGANIVPFMTPQASKFITALSVGWAAESDVIIEEGSHVEHLEDFDLVVVAPATLNSISKAALSIADNVVQLVIAAQFGNKGQVLFVPTMNEKLFRHPNYKDFKKRLEGFGAIFLENALEEARMKMPEPIELANEIEKILGK